MGPEVIASKFEYSPENPPPLEVLESKIFAVHATQTLPQGGILKAGARETLPISKWEGEEPPSFRPTLHFALGGLVKSHHGYDWENHNYAVITPLKTLERQLINVFPQDTFVLGDYTLTTEAQVLVPRGTDISNLPSDIQVIEYSEETGLRATIDEVIEKRKGWHIDRACDDKGSYTESYIEDVDINLPEFFQALFEKFPNVSFGSASYSERGDAFRFATIEQSVDQVLTPYFHGNARQSAQEVKLYKSLIVHNLIRLESSLGRDARFTPQILATFGDKKRQLTGLLNIIDVDLDLRKRSGLTLTDASEEIQNQLKRNRYDAEQLKATIETLKEQLKPAPPEEPNHPFGLADKLRCFSPEELQEFVTDYPDVFQGTDMPEFYANYAIDRWLIIKTKRALEQNLDKILEESIAKFSPSAPREDRHSFLFFSLEPCLKKTNNRLTTALDILRQPALVKHLTKQCGFNFPAEGIQTLEDLIKAHPQTRIIFENHEIQIPEKLQAAHQLCLALRKPMGQDNLNKALQDFEEAILMGITIKERGHNLRMDLETLNQPPKTAGRNFILDGQPLNRRPADYLWTKLGLGKEYRNRFPDDQLFWQNPLPLAEIYVLLKTDYLSNEGRD